MNRGPHVRYEERTSKRRGQELRACDEGVAHAQIDLLLVPAVLAPTLLDGCQTWGPTWSELTGQRYNVTIANRRPAIIDRVDDQGAFPESRT